MYIVFEEANIQTDLTRISSTFPLVSYITFTSKLFCLSVCTNTCERRCRLKTVKMNYLLVIILLVSPCFGDVSHILSEYSTTTTSTTPSPPRPYSFEYQAGRSPGTVDRIHQESGDGSGHIQGSYSFIDPKHKVRTVQYIADETGFHPSLINYEDTTAQLVDSEAVRLAKERHFKLYEKIAEANTHGVPLNLPRDSATVQRAKDRHAQLYQKIAEEHAAIAAQRETERLAYEATSIVNDVNLDQAY